MSILITGGAGYIGSHTAVELLNRGEDVAVADNLCNASVEALKRVERITGKPLRFYEADLRSPASLEDIFRREQVEAVIHFAGLKAVGESVRMPLAYYQNNVAGTINLCQVMETHDVRTLIFSSSATVYGSPERVPVTEDMPLSATNPYGRTKLMIEEILRDLAAADPRWRIVMLRYFNPVGAHESGLIGEDPNGIPNNLAPYITQVATGRREALRIFGNDYDTPDGTGVRDYIHVMDLAGGHGAALERARAMTGGAEVYNLGTGRGTSVLELLETFRRVTGREIPAVYAERRPGDIAVCYASTEKAEQMLGWRAEKTLEDMCRDAWNWQEKNPAGYGG